MLPTVEWIEENYNKFNKEYWGGQLPNIQFKISNTTKYAGLAACYSKKEKDAYGIITTKLIPVSITMSNHYDRDEFVLKCILLHEMIHIDDYVFHPEHFYSEGYDAYGRYHFNKKRYDAHGEFFQDEAKRLKDEGGWEINKSITEEERRKSTLSASNKKRAEEKAKKGFALCVWEKNNGKYCFLRTSLNDIDYKDFFIRNNFDMSKCKKISWYECHDSEFTIIRLQDTIIRRFAELKEEGKYLEQLQSDIANGKMKLLKEYNPNETNNNETEKTFAPYADTIVAGIFDFLMSNYLSTAKAVYTMLCHGQRAEVYRMQTNNYNQHYSFYFYANRWWDIGENYKVDESKANVEYYLYIDLDLLKKFIESDNENICIRIYSNLLFQVSNTKQIIPSVVRESRHRQNRLLRENTKETMDTLRRKFINGLTGLTKVAVKVISKNEAIIGIE